MNDTTPEAARLVRELTLAMTPERRMIAASGMFDLAREMILASLPPGLTGTERRVRLCERLYGGDLARRYAAALAATPEA